MLQQTLCEKPKAVINIKDVQKIAQEVKEKALIYFKNDLAGCCAICSFVIARKLKNLGLSPVLVEGWFEFSQHVWIELNGKIVDVTHCQFIKSKHSVLMINSPSKRYYPVNKYVNFENLLKNTWIKNCKDEIEDLS